MSPCTKCGGAVPDVGCPECNRRYESAKYFKRIAIALGVVAVVQVAAVMARVFA